MLPLARNFLLVNPEWWYHEFLLQPVWKCLGVLQVRSAPAQNLLPLVRVYLLNPDIWYYQFSSWKSLFFPWNGCLQAPKHLHLQMPKSHVFVWKPKIWGGGSLAICYVVRDSSLIIAHQWKQWWSLLGVVRFCVDTWTTSIPSGCCMVSLSLAPMQTSLGYLWAHLKTGGQIWWPQSVCQEQPFTKNFQACLCLWRYHILCVKFFGINFCMEPFQDSL